MQPASSLAAENGSGIATGPAAVPKPSASVSQSSDGVLRPPDARAVRLCHLVRRPDFDGYGFTLHDEKERRVETVATVEPGSPAEAAGLHLKDIIIEVNGVSVQGASHQDILDRIKSLPNEMRLLVASDSTAFWNKGRDTTISGSLPSVTELSSATTADQHVGSGPKATASASSTSSKNTAAGLSVDRDDRQQIVEYTEPDLSRVNLMLDESDTEESFLRRKQESDGQATVRRRAPADKPGTSADGQKSQAKGGPKTDSAFAAEKPGEIAVPCMHLSPLEALEWMLRAVTAMPLPLPLLVGLVTLLLLAVYYFYSYVSREQQT